MSSKLFLGHRLRRLRRDHQLSQTDMAQSLAISPSYLNHL
jgi:cytoskeletal protein RodZ